MGLRGAFSHVFPHDVGIHIGEALREILSAGQQDAHEIAVGEIHHQGRLGEQEGPNEIEVLSGLNPGERVARDAIEAGMALSRQVQ